MAKCYRCKSEYESVDQEDIDGFGFCNPCKKAQQELAEKIPKKQPEENYKEELVAIKSVSGGVVVTTYVDRNSAMLLNKKI